VLAHAEDGVFAAEPDAFDVDVVGQVPYFLGGIDGVCVIAASEFL